MIIHTGILSPVKSYKSQIQRHLQSPLNLAKLLGLVMAILPQTFADEHHPNLSLRANIGGQSRQVSRTDSALLSSKQHANRQFIICQAVSLQSVLR